MTGPPTPPPTSAIEIQDAARASVPPTDIATTTQQTETEAEPIVTDPPTEETPASAASVQQQLTTYYHLLFPTIAELVSRAEYAAVVEVAERGDLHAEHDDHVSRLLLTAPLVLSYLILDSLPPARFALSRIPAVLSSDPLATSLQSLVAAVWEKKYDQVYTRANDVLAVTQQENLASHVDLAPLLSRLVISFVESFRAKTFTLLSKAYSTVPLALAQAYLGMPAEQLLPIAAAHKWSYNEASQVLSPVASPTAVSFSREAGLGSSLATFNSVADRLIIETR
ncbi:COP9 signalosome [Cristinia sonorae]|uniref:COP9 signalosome n=1 Tax=Cristinia sonorae TaxID=1940300 RepID=A0A8K0UNX1_9AGAR|nr:COP9 signalosome [Cristinia sonorae]